jgi:hypothetical protein
MVYRYGCVKKLSCSKSTGKQEYYICLVLQETLKLLISAGRCTLLPPVVVLCAALWTIYHRVCQTVPFYGSLEKYFLS